MEIIGQKKFYGFLQKMDIGYSGLAVLENGAWLLVHDDGSGVTTDGMRYVCVSREIERMMDDEDDPVWRDHETRHEYERRRMLHSMPYSDLETVGWTADAEKPVIIPMDADS